MSFILDALKKSELERQRQTIPGLMDAGPLVRRPRFPLWAIALGVLLAVNLAVLITVLLRGPAHSGATTGLAPSPSSAMSSTASAAAPAQAQALTAPAAASPEGSSSAPALASPPAPLAAAAPGSASVSDRPPEAEAAAAASAERHFSPMDTAPVYAPEIPADDRALLRAAREREASAARAAAEANTLPSRAARGQDPVLTTPADKSDEEVLPTAAELDLANRTPLPELHLDVHVYATRPADRFVYIDNRKYREGSAVAEGLTLERIRRDGVVLNYNGLRFVLPRQ
jgi:general secretion pathway protein B